MNILKHLNIICLLSLLVPFSSFGASDNETATLATISAKAGNFVTPDSDTYFTLLTYSSLQPYTLFRSKPAHDMLKMNYELGIGFAGGENSGTMVSANMLAHRYLTAKTKGFRPFVEAGMGLIYTEFRIPGQGLHLNFNPQVGIGFERYSAKGTRHFASLRFSHISNANFDKDNKAINSLVLSFGHDFYF